jgi:hypothetical protein
MFVDVIENVYGPDGRIPSLVRAYLVEEKVAEFGAEIVDDGLIFLGFRKPTFKLFINLAHRQLSAITDDSRDELSRRLPPRIVQSAIQVVNCVSKEDSEIIEKRRVCELMYEAFRSGTQGQPQCREVLVL